MSNLGENFKNKKIVFVVVIAILVIAMITLGLYFAFNHKNKKTEIEVEGETKSKTEIFYSEILKKNRYTFTQTVDDENKSTIMKDGEKGYSAITVNGNTDYYVVKDGDTYYLDEGEKTYYQYKNNTDTLSKLILILQDLVFADEFKTGNEKINGKNYSYDEFLDMSSFLINPQLKALDASRKRVTRLYYRDNELKYIKTMVGDQEEIIKIELKDEVDQSKFAIPSNYKDVTPKKETISE